VTHQPHDPTDQNTATAQQRVTLPDSLMRAITLVAADPQAPPLAVLEAAVLITFGYALYVQHTSINPRRVAIPTQQWEAVCQALTNVHTLSEVGRVNLALDWVNIGPASFDPQPACEGKSR
jgi:hypothetical protein